MNRKDRKGWSFVIGSCNMENTRLAVTMAAKLAYAPRMGDVKVYKPQLTTFEACTYKNVLIVENSNFTSAFYSRVCEALDYPLPKEDCLNPLFFHIPQSKRIIDDGYFDKILTYAIETSTDTIVFPTFDIWSRAYHSMQKRIENTICMVDFITDMGFDVIYTTPDFEDDDFIKDGSWPRNSFFKSASHSLFIQDNDDLDDTKTVRRLVRGYAGKPFAISAKVLDRIAILDQNDLAALGKSF